jgi:hypothetical protein
VVQQPLFLLLIVFCCIIFFGGRLPFLTKIEVLFHFSKILLFVLLFVFGCIIFFVVFLHFQKKLRSSFFKKKCRSSFIFKNIGVVFHISSSWARLRLHTKNQLPRLPGSCLRCNHIRCGLLCFVGWVVATKTMLKNIFA